MTKQQAYAELRKMLDQVNSGLDAARAFADEHDLVMSHKDNSKVMEMARRQLDGDDEPVEDDFYDDEHPSVEDLLVIRTLKASETKTIDSMLGAEDGFDYCWMPSSMGC
jgi:hypothetical protein